MMAEIAALEYHTRYPT